MQPEFYENSKQSNEIVFILNAYDNKNTFFKISSKKDEKSG